MNKLQDLHEHGSGSYSIVGVVLALIAGFLFGAAFMALFLFNV